MRVVREFGTKSAQDKMSPRLGQPSGKTHPHLLKRNEVTPGMSQAEYQDRRARLIGSLADDSIVLIPAAKHLYMTNDIPYVFRQNSDFSYMTGCQEPGSVMALYKDTNGDPIFHLFMRPRSQHSELWDGPRTGVERAPEFFACDVASNVEEFPQILKQLMEKKSAVYWRDIETDVTNFKELVLGSIKAKNEASIPVETVELNNIMCYMRLVKTNAELNVIRKSCSISANAFIDTMKATKPDCSEHEMSARIEWECRRRGSQRLAYPPVVATGISCNTLHYVMNDSIAKNGDLLLMDAGGEYFDYASDITRTWPTNGIFSPGQRIVYEAVLRTQKKVIEAIAAHFKGTSSEHREISLATLQQVAVDSIGEELHQMGIRDLDRIAEVYPHMIGHYLGMDVHDVPRIPYQRALRPGMIITVEPGLYMPDEPWVPELLRGVGVRIEDDVLITDGEPEVLTREAPKEVDDLQAIIGTNIL